MSGTEKIPVCMRLNEDAQPAPAETVFPGAGLDRPPTLSEALQVPYKPPPPKLRPGEQWFFDFDERMLRAGRRVVLLVEDDPTECYRSMKAATLLRVLSHEIAVGMVTAAKEVLLSRFTHACRVENASQVLASCSQQFGLAESSLPVPRSAQESASISSRAEAAWEKVPTGELADVFRLNCFVKGGRFELPPTVDGKGCAWPSQILQSLARVGQSAGPSSAAATGEEGEDMEQDDEENSNGASDSVGSMASGCGEGDDNVDMKIPPSFLSSSYELTPGGLDRKPVPSLASLACGPEAEAASSASALDSRLLINPPAKNSSTLRRSSLSSESEDCTGGAHDNIRHHSSDMGASGSGEEGALGFIDDNIASQALWPTPQPIDTPSPYHYHQRQTGGNSSAFGRLAAAASSGHHFEGGHVTHQPCREGGGAPSPATSSVSSHPVFPSSHPTTPGPSARAARNRSPSEDRTSDRLPGLTSAESASNGFHSQSQRTCPSTPLGPVPTMPATPTMAAAPTPAHPVLAPPGPTYASAVDGLKKVKDYLSTIPEFTFCLQHLGVIEGQMAAHHWASSLGGSARRSHM